MRSLVAFAARRPAGVESRSRRAHRINLACESLEERRLLSANATADALAQLTAQADVQVLALDTTGPTGLSPQQIRSAYGIDHITFSGGTITGNGAGQTIAIIEAYNDPNISADLAAFDAEYGLPAPPSLTVDNLGATTTDAGWALETSLDVEWAHAIAPAANIVVVEASSASVNALFSAVRAASQLPGVSVVSMSWGTYEFAGETAYDSLFTTPAGHTNVTYVAASGDSGAWYGPMYPAVSPNVLAVGGSSLTLGSGNSYGSESGWTYSTGGFSGTDTRFRSYESEPSYQASTLQSVGLSDGVRTTPDVSFNADPSSGYSVYDSVGYDGQSGWFQVGGTSAAAPAWAGLIAIADQGLANGGKGTLSTSQVLTELYSLPSSDFNDVTSGSNGYSATTGYDLVTGLGTPRTASVVAGLLAANGVSESGTSSSSSGGGSPTSTGSTGTTTSTPTSTPTPTPTPAPTSPPVSHTKTHHTKVQHTKVQRTRVQRAKVKQTKVSHSNLLASSTSDSGGGSATSTGPGATSLATSSNSAVISASANTGSATSSTGSAQAVSLSALPSPTLSIPASNANAQQAQPVPTSAPLTSQSLATSSSLGQDLAPLSISSSQRVSAVAEQPQLAGTIDYVEPMPAAAQSPLRSSGPASAPSPEDVPAPPRAVPSRLSVDPAMVDLDEALAQVDEALAQMAESLLTMRPGPIMVAPTSPGPAGPVRPEFGVSTLIGTAALAAGGYQLVLRQPDERRNPWRYP
jgi:hypothetical protein